MGIDWKMTLKDFREGIDNNNYLERIMDLREQPGIKKYNYDFLLACLLGGTKEKTSSARKYDDRVKNATWSSNCGHAFINLNDRNDTIRNIPDPLNNYLAGIDEEQNLEYIKNLIVSGTIEEKSRPYSLKEKQAVINALYLITDVEMLEGEGESNVKNNNGIMRTIIDFINNDVKQIVLTGAPGTGKTFLARDLAVQLTLKAELYKKYSNGNKDTKREIDNLLFTGDAGDSLNMLVEFFGTHDINTYKNRVGFVQFHPSYDYTDFVEGLRPVMKGAEIGFDLVDGIFMSFCDNASKQPNEKYLFIIDEINRADLSKVFGELMFALEEGYRGKTFKTQYSSLRESIKNSGREIKTEFTIPENVYIIGTMNDIDRSVDTFDFALRRRFTWVEMDANDVMKDVLESMLVNEDKELVGGLLDSAIRLNKEISSKGQNFNLNKQFQLGPAYFGKAILSEGLETAKSQLWNFRIEPLLREYVRGHDEKAIETFVSQCREVFAGDV